MMADMALRLLHSDGQTDDHGGNLDRAKALFPLASEPWIDLSTGINPHSYPVSELPAKTLSRLPEPGRLRQLKHAAAVYYGAQSPEVVVASPGTQPLMQLVASLVEPGTARILGPTYSEHARCALLTGHRVEEVGELAELETADLAIVVNPNNPDGRLHRRADLWALAHILAKRGGLLVIDEAFMDVAPGGHSLAGDLADNIVVLRSFGKFFGLAGVRLGFAVAPNAIAGHLETALGPWPISAPALEYGLRALNDTSWQVAMRRRLAADMSRLRNFLMEGGLSEVGGTDLFRLVRHPDAADLFNHLGQAGILVRRFSDRPHLLRIGLPADSTQRDRLAATFENWTGAVEH